MSWYNPSQDEAADEYYASKSRYMNAASQRNSSMRAATACTMEKAAVAGIIGTCTSQKLNFEKRIEDIRTIVGAIEGNGGGNILISSMGGDLPNIISAFNASVGDADMSYHGSMKCSDITPANLSEVFRSKSVTEDSWLSNALTMFKNEITRLEQALQDLQNQINTLNDLTDELTSKINMYNAETISCRRIMVNCAFEMKHFRMYM